MFRLASNRRPFLKPRMKPAHRVAVTSMMTLVLSIPLLVGANHAASQTQPASQAAPDKPEEAPTGFNNLTNGFETQDAFDKDRDTFEEVESITDGLGPVYNATSCVSCHQNPVTGSSS